MFQADSVILSAIIAQALLTLAVYVALAVAKSRARGRGEVDAARSALHGDAWPDSVVKINNNIRNQFELPVLFYVACFVIMATNGAGAPAQVLAWLFVATRALHAFVHTTTNVVPVRRALFQAGFLVVLAMFLLALWQLAGA